MQATAPPSRSASYSILEKDSPLPETSGSMFYANVFGEGEMWCWHCGSRQEAAGRWDDHELVDVWSYGEQWTAFHEPAYRQGYG